MYGYRGFYFDWTYLLVLIGVLLCLGASAMVRSNFQKYSKVRSRTGMTGAEAARRILSYAGITDVQIRTVGGQLTDHYDPPTKVVFRLEEKMTKPMISSCTIMGVPRMTVT